MITSLRLQPKINTEAEITAMLEALRDTLANGRFARVSPAYVKGNRVWSIGKNGKLASKVNHPQAQPLNWAFSHNVSPAKKAWGASGCADCHNEKSEFFNSPVVVDPFDSKGKPVTVPMWKYVGLKQSVIRK